MPRRYVYGVECDITICYLHMLNTFVVKLLLIAAPCYAVGVLVIALKFGLLRLCLQLLCCGRSHECIALAWPTCDHVIV